jgi:hypothetical protein
MPKSDYFKPMGRSDMAASAKKQARGDTLAHVNRESKADREESGMMMMKTTKMSRPKPKRGW